MYEAETVDVPKDKVRVCSKKGCLGIYSEFGEVGAYRYVPKEKSHGLKNLRCTGICPFKKRVLW
jgi:hypothetical protein